MWVWRPLVIHYSQFLKSRSWTEKCRTGLLNPGLWIFQEQSSRSSQPHCVRWNAPKNSLKLPSWSQPYKRQYLLNNKSYNRPLFNVKWNLSVGTKAENSLKEIKKDVSATPILFLSSYSIYLLVLYQEFRSLIGYPQSILFYIGTQVILAFWLISPMIN